MRVRPVSEHMGAESSLVSTHLRLAQTFRHQISGSSPHGCLYLMASHTNNDKMQECSTMAAT